MVWEHIAANRRRTVILFLVFLGLMALVAWALDIAFGPAGAALIGGWALATALVALVGAHRSVLLYTGARRATPEEFRYLSHLTEGLALAAQIPTPACYVVEDEAPNAFATGLPGKGATVCVTTGLLKKLDRQELEGVVAHEIAHIANHDTRVMSAAFVFAFVISAVSDIAIRAMRWGAFSGRGGGSSRGGRKKGGGGLLILVALVIIIVAPIVAKLLTMAVSRQREYLADSDAARLTRNPWGLASALRKIAGDPDPVDKASLATAHLWISNPLREGMLAHSLFSTHPPIEERIKRLEAM